MPYRQNLRQPSRSPSCSSSNYSNATIAYLRKARQVSSRRRWHRFDYVKYAKLNKPTIQQTRTFHRFFISSGHMRLIINTGNDCFVPGFTPGAAAARAPLDVKPSEASLGYPSF